MDPRLREPALQCVRGITQPRNGSLCKIAGVRDAFSPHAVLELISVSVGEVRIRSVETGLYLSMGSDGKVRAESSADSEETVFIENVSGPYLTYLR